MQDSGFPLLLSSLIRQLTKELEYSMNELKIAECPQAYLYSLFYLILSSNNDNIFFTVINVEFDDMPSHKVYSKITNFAKPLNWIIVNYHIITINTITLSYSLTKTFFCINRSLNSYQTIHTHIDKSLQISYSGRQNNQIISIHKSIHFQTFSLYSQTSLNSV